MLGPIDTVRLFTDDTARAAAFYRDALGLKEVVSDEGLAIFDTGSAKLMLEAIDPEDAEGDDLIGRFTGVSFAVADIRGTVSALEAKGVTFDGRPELQPWGGALAHFFDPDGNILTLVQYPTPD
jgi:catechol 2,3-dioxygenase-like lactoylglutathione lyase family enzyme